jgi:hypothetical protein
MRTSMLALALLGGLGLGGCREFYDEEFKEFNESRRNDETTTGGDGRDDGVDVPPASYTAELRSTDANLPDLSGTARIEVRDGDVRVDLDVDGLPANIIQVHYAYVAADCAALTLRIPNNNGERRSYTISETSSVRSLIDDLRATGAARTEGDANLEGKRVVVKAFTNFAGPDSPVGGSQLTVACGTVVRGDVDGTGPTTIPRPTDTIPTDPFPDAGTGDFGGVPGGVAGTTSGLGGAPGTTGGFSPAF